jgi:hypothetical protein
MNKPLRYYMLEDVQKYCKSQKKCELCDFENENGYCIFSDTRPSGWKLPARKFTKQEVQNAKEVIKTLGLTPDAIVEHSMSGFFYVKDTGKGRTTIAKDLFPTLELEESAKLADIAKYKIED